MRGLLCVLAACAAVAVPARTAEPPGPDPSLSPRRVVEIQLEALQHNDDPEADAGIARTWAFAHPQNKRMTGPLERFKAMIESPMYRMLIDHRSHEIERVEVDDDRARFIVTVVAGSGRVVAYAWKLARVESGPQAGAWMTIRVSPPIERGDSV